MPTRVLAIISELKNLDIPQLRGAEVENPVKMAGLFFFIPAKTLDIRTIEKFFLYKSKFG